MENVKEYLDWLDGNRNLALGLVSDPGVGKTSMVNQWAKDHGRKVFSLVVSQRSPTEVAGMAMPDNETQKMCVYDFDSLLDLEDGDILFLDEFGNGNPMTINATLTVVLDRMLPSGRKLKDIMVVAACNPQGCTMFTPQVKQRFIWKQVYFARGQWEDYMASKYWLFNRKVLKKASELVMKEKYEKTDWNYLSPRSAEIILQLTQYQMGTDHIVCPYKPSQQYQQMLEVLDSFFEQISIKVLVDLQSAKIDCEDSSFATDLVEAGNHADELTRVKAICKKAADGEYGMVIQKWITKNADLERELDKDDTFAKASKGNVILEEVIEF